jgi:PAS domain S-box-containing protein
MYQSSFQQTDAFLNRPMRVLLSMGNARDSSLLAEQLRSNDIDVVVAGTDESLPQCDLCVVDSKRLEALTDDIQSRREKLGAVQLPVLLVLGRKESVASTTALGDRVDDVISVPTSGEVFQNRVDALLRLKKQSEQLALFARAMDDSTAGISIADASGDQELRYVNDAFCEMTGYEREEVLGRNCRFLQGPETDPEPVRRVRAALDRREPVSVEIRNYRKDGELFWNALEIAPVYSEHGVSHFVGFQNDITERVEQTRALQRYEEIVNAAGDPIYALDRDLRFTLLNGATAALSTLEESDILGTPVENVFGQDHAEVLEAAVLDLANNRTEERTIGTIVRDAQGRHRRFQTTIATLPTLEFEGVVCVSRDITQDREREARLSVLDRVLRHNLRNKLMVMLAQVEQIQQQTDQPAVGDAATTLERAAENLLDLAETARKFKQTVDPKADDAIGPVDVASHTRQAVKEARLDHEAVTFSVDLPATLWATAHESFELAMTELLDQATDADDTAEVTVGMSIDGTDETVTLRLAHDGTGPSDVEVSALNAGAETDLEHTTGLGLWFVRWMAVNSGGRFEIVATDPGMVVELTLPLADTPMGTTTRT